MQEQRETQPAYQECRGCTNVFAYDPDADFCPVCAAENCGESECRANVGESTVVEALLSRDETYTDGAYRCRLQNTAHPVESTRVCVSAKGSIQWAADWILVHRWAAEGLLRRVDLGPACYGDVEVYAPGF